MSTLFSCSDFFSGISSGEICNAMGLTKMISGFLLNFLVVWFICHFLYYPKSRRRDYYFTFLILSVSIYMMIFLMDGSHIEIGAALGLFAVFGIIRYRTESIPIREMTYLFFIVALSVVNGTMAHLSLLERIAANAIFLGTAWIAESFLLCKKEGCKYVKYDKIELIHPDRYNELLSDLETRLGLKISRIEVGAVDFLKDMCHLSVYYKDTDNRIKSIDHIQSLPNE